MSAARTLTQFKKIVLQVATGPTKGEAFHLVKPLVRIGRASENDIVLDKDAKISRFHLEIRQSKGMISVHNVSDKNSMLVNGRVLKNAVVDGNVSVVIGDTQLNLLFDAQMLAVRSNVPQTVGGMPIATTTQSLPQSMPYSVPAFPTAAHAHAAVSAGYQTKPFVTANTQESISMNSNVNTFKNRGSPKILIYSVLGVLLVAGAFFFSKPSKNPKRVVGIKTTEEFQGEVETSTKATETRNKELEKMGENTLQYDMAQQQYLKGFRDFHHQQYARAIISLRAALSYYPQHELARRYLSLAEKKVDELVRAQMESGAKYKGQGNYRMCIASYYKVLRMIEDPEDKNYKAAEQFLKECEAEKKERY